MPFTHPPATGLEHCRVADLDLLIRRGIDCRPPLLLLHGIGSRSFSFVPLMNALHPSRTVIAWDAPGYGGSTPLSMAEPAVSDYAAAVIKLLDAYPLLEIDLVGHSLGTLIAAHVAARMPDRVRRLALLSPTFGYGVRLGEPLPQSVADRPKELVALGAETFARKRGPRLVHAPDTKPDVAEAVVTAMSTMTLPGYGQATHLLGTGHLLEDINKLCCPTLIAVGAEDVVTPPEIARRVAEVLPQKATSYPNAVEIPLCGHAVYLEDPVTVARILERHF